MFLTGSKAVGGDCAITNTLFYSKDEFTDAGAPSSLSRTSGWL